MWIRADRRVIAMTTTRPGKYQTTDGNFLQYVGADFSEAFFTVKMPNTVRVNVISRTPATKVRPSLDRFSGNSQILKNITCSSLVWYFTAQKPASCALMCTELTAAEQTSANISCAGLDQNRKKDMTKNWEKFNLSS
jgi:hypothetical protein